MQQPEVKPPRANRGDDGAEARAGAPAAEVQAGPSFVPQAEGGACRCGGAAGLNPNGTEAAAYVYALGRVETRFPSLAMEKEFAQATGRAGTAGLTDRGAVRAVLGERPNRYLARQLCWVLKVQEVETYILIPRDPADYDLLLETVRANPRPTDVDAVIGVRGPIAPPEACNGLLVPLVAFDQIYSFDVETLRKAIPRPEAMTAEKFESAAEEVFYKILQMADNAGATDEHRALNYLAVRYPAIYEQATKAYQENYASTGVEVRLSPLSGVRKIVDVIFSFTHRQTDVTEKYFVRVDVTEEFPFLVSKLSRYYER